MINDSSPINRSYKMKILESIIFIFALMGILIVYPLYFVALSDFSKKLLESHKADLETSSQYDVNGGLAEAYRVLHSAKGGMIGDVKLCAEVMAERRGAIRLLYTGATLFLVLLSVILIESILSR